MSDWENEDFEPIINSNGNVKDSWDDEEEEDQTPTKQVEQNTVSVPKKKKSLSEKIAEREAERLKKQEELDKIKSLSEDPNETEAQRRAREQKQVLDADLQNAKDLFGELQVKDTSEKSSVDIFAGPFNEKSDFEQVAKNIVDKSVDLQKSIYYSVFVESLIRDLVAPMSLEDTRKISSTLTALINEKQKALSNKKKKTATKAKASLRSLGSETASYGNDLYAGEYDDFM